MVLTHGWEQSFYTESTRCPVNLIDGRSVFVSAHTASLTEENISERCLSSALRAPTPHPFHQLYNYAERTYYVFFSVNIHIVAYMISYLTYGGDTLAGFCVQSRDFSRTETKKWKRSLKSTGCFRPRTKRLWRCDFCHSWRLAFPWHFILYLRDSRKWATQRRKGNSPFLGGACVPRLIDAAVFVNFLALWNWTVAERAVASSAG